MKMGPKEKREPQPGYMHELVGDHSPRCLREKHEDWQHGLETCAVSERTQCDCTAHWREIR